jgi:acyl carrier protein
MREKIVQTLADTLGLPPGEIDATTTMETQPAWDSVAHLNFVMSLEQEFGVQFDPEEMMQMGSVPAVEAALARKGVR